MKISDYNSNNTTTFSSRFNMDNKITSRSVNALKRTITGHKGQEDLFEKFISKIANDGKNDIFELSQFEKYYILTNSSKKRKFIKIKNITLINDIKNFVGIA